MKTILTYLLLIIIAVTSVSGQIIEEKERYLFAKSKVKERTKYDYKYAKGKFAKNGVKTSVSKYNTDGLTLETLTFNKEGNTIISEKYNYDKNGNRILYARKSISGTYKKASKYNYEDNIVLESGYDGSETFRTTYKYNSENRLTEIAYFTSNTLDEKRTYKYNGNNATVKILHQGKDLKSTIKLSFNNNNQIIEEKTISLKGVVLEKRLIEYSNGLILKEEKYRAGNLLYKILYHYNSKGYLLKVTEESKSKGKLDKKLYSYDSYGRVIEYKWKRKPNEEYNIKTYKYNPEGVCSEEHTYYPRTDYRLLSKYKYKF